MTTPRTLCVVDLPVRCSPGCGDVIRETYCEELKAVKTQRELRAFAKRWRNLFLVKTRPEDQELTDEEQKIVDGTFNAQQALRCIRENRVGKAGCTHVRSKKGKPCVGICFLLPAPLMEIDLLAQRFCAPSDTAWIQLGRAVCPGREDELNRLFG